jgi:hypothetical protein
MAKAVIYKVNPSREEELANRYVMDSATIKAIIRIHAHARHVVLISNFVISTLFAIFKMAIVAFQF